jgi:hypothetical protein
MSKVLSVSIALLLLSAPAWAYWSEADGHSRTELRELSDEVSPDLASVIIPEPITLLVLGLGLIPVLLKRRKSNLRLRSGRPIQTYPGANL